MRLMFVVPPLTGHVNPTVALAAEAQARGHRISWCAHPKAVRPRLPKDAEVLELDDEVPEDLLASKQAQAERVRGLPALKFLWEEFLIPLAHAMREPVEQAIADWKPDVVCVDHQAVGGALAARRSQTRWATLVTTSASIADPLSDLPKVQAWQQSLLAKLESEAGLPATPTPDLSPHRVLVLSTSALLGDTSSYPESFSFVGPAFGGGRPEVPFPWEQLRDDLPKVLVSLGTVNAKRGARFFGILADALGEQSMQAIVVAPQVMLPNPLPPLIRQDYVPQLRLLERVQAVVSHGGHNTVCETLAAGVPLVVAPIKDDQPVVAQQVEEAGAGLRVNFKRCTAEQLRQALHRVLTEDSFAQSAARIGESFGAAGGAPRAVNLLEDLL